MENTTIEKQKSFRTKIKEGIQSFTALSFVLLGALLLLNLFELIYNGFIHEFPENIAYTMLASFTNMAMFWLKFTGLLTLIFLAIYTFSEKVAKLIFSTLATLIVIIQFALINYFSVALVPLGSDLWGYSKADIVQTIGSAGVMTATNIIGFLVILAGGWFLFFWLPRKIRINRYAALSVLLVSLLLLLNGTSTNVFRYPFKSDFSNNLVTNKSDYFYSASYDHFFPEKLETDIYADSYVGLYGDEQSGGLGAFHYVDQQKYPFLHSDSTQDVLSPFLNKANTPPNIVIILVEGLGRAFTNDGAYLGNFTPFVDSLSKKSLYWENFLSEGGRTFAVLPSVLGSLPFAKNGFLEIPANKMPAHLSLVSLLKYNGYNTSFYYGGEAQFDNMSVFLRKNGIDELNDGPSFPAGYTKLPASNGFTWGYSDGELFRRYFDTRPDAAGKPQLSVLLTVSSHSPFHVNDENKYLQRFERRMDELGFDAAKKQAYRNYELQYASILYTDDALRSFFEGYKKRKDFGNTIFLITGDHRMPEIPMSDKIDRYHVPLIVYSPLLKRTAKFSSVSTHFDITPSLLAFLGNTYKIKKPSLVSWVGQGLDTARSFRNAHNYPFIQTKTDIVDFVSGDYHLNGNTLYKLNSILGEDPVPDQEKLEQLRGAFEEFKLRNDKISNGSQLIPDSIYRKYFPAK